MIRKNSRIGKKKAPTLRTDISRIVFAGPVCGIMRRYYITGIPVLDKGEGVA